MDLLPHAPEQRAGVLSAWLGDLPLRAFLRRVYGRQPYARPGLARAAEPVCSWSVLDRVLRATPAPDVLVIARGEVVDEPPPRSLPELGSMFERGIGIVLRHAEREDAGIAALCADLARDVPGEQRVLVFATPGGTHGFGWHYDPEEVFVLQTAGDKEYFFRQNTLVPAPQRGVQPDFSIVRHETTPVMGCRLLAGDWLYLPRGYWHVAHPHQDSLSLSIGVFPPDLEAPSA